jgi:hypothetical protein
VNGPGEQFPFVEMDPAVGAFSQMPYLPITLALDTQSVLASGLVDSGAAISAMPYSLGTQLGAVWEQQTTPLKLTGNLAGLEARALLVTATVGKFGPVRLVFAWAQVDQIPVILGQMNFFMEFDVCFFRARSVFEVRPKNARAT